MLATTSSGLTGDPHDGNVKSVQNLIGTGELSAPNTGLTPVVAVLAPAVAVLAPAQVPRRPCQISFEGMPASEPPRVEVYAWLEKLGILTAAMKGGQVQIEAVERGRQPQHYRVRMDLTLATGVVVVDHDHPNNGPHEDVYVAIRNGFRAARRQLETHAQAHSQAIDALAIDAPATALPS